MTNEEVEALVAVSEREIVHTVAGWLCVYTAIYRNTPNSVRVWDTRIVIGTTSEGIETREQALAKLGQMLEAEECVL
jgi:hypothetical protein